MSLSHLFLFFTFFVIVCPINSSLPVIWLSTVFPSEGWSDGIECYPAVQMAIDEINNSSEYLPNYQIDIMMNDTKCNPLITVASELEQQATHPVTAIIGAGCSVESIPLSYLASYLHVPQLSYASTDPELSNKELYPYFLRVVPTDIIQAQTWIAILKHYKWTQVATLNSQETLFALLAGFFLENAPIAVPQLEIISAETFPGSENADVTLQLSNIKSSGATIIFVACYETDSINIFNTAASLGMTGGTYAWIGIDAGFSEMLPTEVEDPNYVAGVIATSPAAGSSAASALFHLKYEALTGSLPGTYTVYTEFAYDAAYAMAKALHQVIEVQNIPYDPLNPSAEFGEILLHTIWNTSFVGVTAGTVVLDKNGDRLLPYDIFDYRGLDYVKVANWDPVTNLYIEYPAGPVVWADGTTVVPSNTLLMVTYTLNVVLKNVGLVLAILFIIVTVVFMVGVYYWREHPRMKAATSSFMMIILFSALCSYSVVILIYIEPVNNFTCIAPHWFGHLAFFFSFGCLFAKTFRIWQIYSNATKLKTVKITDQSLLLFVLVFSSIGVVLLVVFTVMSSPVPTYRKDVEIVQLQYLECKAPQYGVLIGLFIFEFVSLFFGVFLSFKTRKIELLKFNESSQIALCIYNLVFIGFIFVPMAYFLQSLLSPDLTFLISAGGILIGTTTVVFVLFVPKFRAIIKKKPDNNNTTREGIPTDCKRKSTYSVPTE